MKDKIANMNKSRINFNISKLEDMLQLLPHFILYCYKDTDCYSEILYVPEIGLKIYI